MRSTLPALFAASLLAVAAAAQPRSEAPEISPHSLTLRLGEAHQFHVKVRGATAHVVWSVEGEEPGTVSQDGFYQAPLRARTPETVRVTVGPPGEGAERAVALVQIEPVSVTARPATVPLTTQQNAQFHAEVKGAGDQRVTWSVDGGPPNGRVTRGGLYTAPSSFTTPGTVTVRATSVADPSKSATCAVRIGAVGITVEPKEVTLAHGRVQRFGAKVTGTPNTEVLWKVEGGEGTISSAGLYTPPEHMQTPAEITIVGSPAADPSKSATARIHVPAIRVRARAPKHSRLTARKLANVAFSGVRRVSRLYLPLSPLDLWVPGPLFKDKAGKQYVPLGGTVFLGAGVTGSTNDRIDWVLEGNQIGELSMDGYYQAPDSLTTPQLVQVRATSEADPTKSVLYTLTIPAVVVRTEKLPSPICPLDGAVQLRAHVENAENDRILWSVDGGERNGSVSDGGLYRPPPQIPTPATVRIRATSAADPTKSAVYELQIPEVRLTISPASDSVRPAESIRFRARVRGFTGDATVDWKVVPEVGSISPDGVYRAPEKGAPEVVQVIATLHADPTKTAVATLRLRGR